MRAIRTSNAVLNIAGLIIASALFSVATEVRPPAQNLLLGTATSFIFITILDILFTAQSRILNVARTKFFGPELARGSVTFACPDFEPHREVRRALQAA